MEKEFPNPEGEQAFNLRRSIWEWVESIAVSLTVLILLFTFVFKIIGISGSSMEHTLHENDRVIAFSLFYTPAQGDIVVVNQPNEFGKPIIKRVIATENQVVDINFETGEVFVDDVLLDEPYLSTPTTLEGSVSFPVTVEEGRVFVMGDNRQHSTDSRHTMIGQIDIRYILGKAIVRIYPFDQIGLLN